MKGLSKHVLLFFWVLAVVGGCKDELEKAPQLTIKTNKFIKEAMDYYYLWYNEMPDIDYDYEFDPEAYFYKLLNDEDKWSYITDDIEAFENSLEGVEKTFGYMLGFGRFLNSGKIFAIVEYVYPGSPALEAGLKRGDIIIKMDNSDITEENYTDLLYADNISITLGIQEQEGISEGTQVSLTSEVLTLDPVQIKKIVEIGGHKIGYLFYTQFIHNFNASLDNAFQYFQQQGVTDLVVDLRYNPGGQISAAQHLCSSVAPLNIVNNNEPLVTLQWNDKLQSYFNQNSSIYSDYLETDFVNNTAVKLGFDKLYILTGYGTASASELTITGLKPYMNVTTIGDTTYGKYTASITLKPEDIYKSESYYDEINHWGLQPIVLRYANSAGVTDFKDGFAPDILTYDDIWKGIPLGENEDPLLKAAIENITGVEVLAIKSARRDLPEHTLFDQGFSKFDANKRELIYDIEKKRIFDNE